MVLPRLDIIARIARKDRAVARAFASGVLPTFERRSTKPAAGRPAVVEVITDAGARAQPGRLGHRGARGQRSRADDPQSDLASRFRSSDRLDRFGKERELFPPYRRSPCDEGDCPLWPGMGERASDQVGAVDEPALHSHLRDEPQA